jgi:WhiB family transcriptional regulator, redox-sensing transcriptional regulator
MVRVTRVRTHSRRTPPLDAWHNPPERLEPTRQLESWPWTWQQDAACRNLGSSLFFSPSGERAAARRRREAAAKAICGRCPVRMPCVIYALATRQRYGVWGGLTEDDRRQPVADERWHTWTPRRRPARGQP